MSNEITGSSLRHIKHGCCNVLIHNSKFNIFNHTMGKSHPCLAVISFDKFRYNRLSIPHVFVNTSGLLGKIV